MGGDGGRDFEVGDTLNFESLRGAGAVGRVSRVTRGTGEVRFSIADSGWGFSVNLNSNQPLQSKTYLSDRILTISGAEPGAGVSSIAVTNGGSGYSNTDVIVISGQIENALAVPTTDGSGVIQSARIIRRGVGFYPDRISPVIEIRNSLGEFSTGTGATFTPTYRYPKSYLKYLETLTQKIQIVTYSEEVGVGDFLPGVLVSIGGFGTGEIISVNLELNEVVIVGFDNVMINPGNRIELLTDSNRYIIVDDVVVEETTAKVINVAIVTGKQIGRAHV